MSGFLLSRSRDSVLVRPLTSVYGKPLLPASGGQPSDNALHFGSSLSDSDEPELLGGAFTASSFTSTSCSAAAAATASSVPSTAEAPELAERTAPRPLSPTKLLPFLSQHPHRNPSDADLDALRRRLRLAPRPLKKRSSITEPEGPAGPNIQKLLYQKTTLAAMETMETVEPVAAGAASRDALRPVGAESEEPFSQVLSEGPPPLPPRSPLPDSSSSSSSHALPPPLEEDEGGERRASLSQDEFPPYPPPPYSGRSQKEEEPEVSPEATLPPVRTRTHTHTHTHTYRNIVTHTLTHTHTHTHTYRHIVTRTLTPTHTHTYGHIVTRTLTPTHTHAHI